MTSTADLVWLPKVQHALKPNLDETKFGSMFCTLPFHLLVSRPVVWNRIQSLWTLPGKTTRSLPWPEDEK